MTETTAPEIHPLADRLLVLPDHAEKKSTGGIVLPEQSVPQPTTGKVVAIGRGKQLDDGTFRPMEIQLGERVLYQKFGGQPVVGEDGVEYLLLLESEVLAVLGKRL